MLRTAFGVVVCVAVLLPARPAESADAVVGTGTSGSCTEAALDSAVATVLPGGGTITFNCGGAKTITLTSHKLFFYAPNPYLTYTIDGGGLITLNGGNLTRHIFHMSGILNIRNITFTGGRAVGNSDQASGGAIRSDRDVVWVPNPVMALNLTNVTFSGNSTSLTGWSAPYSQFDYGGGAVFARLVHLTVVNSTFANNTAGNSAGGAIHGRSSTVAVSGSVFTTNVSNGGGFGGAIHVDGLSPAGANGTMTITTSSFSGNTALNQGGAIYFYLYPAKVESVTIDTVNVTGNHVVDSGQIGFVGNRGIGGGLAGDGGDLTIRNSTFAGNTARGEIATGGGGAGGGISLYQNGTVVISNTTISGNQAIGSNSDASGGGLLVYNNVQPFQVVHSTIAFNQAGWTGGGIQSTTNGILTNSVVANNTAANPGFGSTIQQQCSSQLTNGAFALQYPDIVGAPSAGNPRCANMILTTNPLLPALASNGGFTQTHHPQAGSPLIDAATCLVSTDQRGSARPQGSACEIGAVEVLAAPATGLGLDGPASGAVVISPVGISGWALDPGAGPNNGPGVDLVAIYAGSTCSGSALAQGAPSGARPDVRTYFGLDASYTNSGYGFAVSPTPGPFTFTVCARSSVNGQFTASITRTITVSAPQMNVDAPSAGAAVPVTFTVSGWAFDSGAGTGSGVDLVRVFAGSACSGSILADATLGIARPDVRTAFGLPASFGSTGFSAAVTAAAGTQQISVCARSTVTGGFVLKVTRTLSVSDPVMSLDGPAQSAGVLAPFVVGGWAFDRGAATGPGIDLVRIFAGTACAGTVLATATLGLSRADVQSAFGLPTSFGTTGFTASVTPAGIGGQVFTVCARSTVTGTFAAQVTRMVIVSNTVMNVDMPGHGTAVPTSFTVMGWAFDNGAGASGPGVDLVRIFAGTACSGTVLVSAATLGVPRGDVQTAMGLPASYANSGFQASITTAPGVLTFTVCARSAVTGTFTRAVLRTVMAN